MMSEPKWTPGPWRVAYHDGNFQAVVMNDHIEICTCWHHSVEAIEEQMAANARLIAAAPEMYVALSRLLYRYHPYRDNQDDSDWAAAVAAIAKARGAQ